MKRYMTSTLLLLAVLVQFPLYGQDESDNEPFRRHRLSLAMGHSHIPSAVQGDGGKKQVMIPSWGLGYQYKVNKQLSIGLKSDFEFSNYVIKDENERELERENPISLSLAVEYKVYKGLGFSLAPGMEFEKEENLFIVTFGALYEFEFNERWDFTPELLYELKGGHTGALIFAFGIGYSF